MATTLFHPEIQNIKWMKGKVSFVVGLLGILSSYFLSSGEPRNSIFKISLGFVLGGLIEAIVFVIENKKRWGIIKTVFIKPNQPVRVTVAYLFRIEVNGKFVLVKRHKKDNQGFQPVGGAYKYLKEENRELFEKLGIEPCNHVPRDEDTENDLRIVIKKRKNLAAFIKWFEGRKNRELDPYREFCEELITPGFLPHEAFKHIKYIFVGNHIEGVIKSPVYPEDELRYADIFELRLENDAQKKAIQDLKSQTHEILFATPSEIKRRASVDAKVILPHTFKILPK